MEKEQKIKVIRIIASIVLLMATYILAIPEEIHIGLCAIAYVIIGADIVYAALRNLCKGQFLGESFLMTIATVGAFVIGEYPEAVAVMMFYQIGELFSDIAVETKPGFDCGIDGYPSGLCQYRERGESNTGVSIGCPGR